MAREADPVNANDLEFATSIIGASRNRDLWLLIIQYQGHRY